MLGRISEIVAKLVVFVFGLLISFKYGQMGLHPLDSSIVFDGASRLLAGQQFFHEFSSPAGFCPIWLQALFFKLFGISWRSYILHAAIMNGLFGILVMAILRGKNMGILAASIYGLFATVLLYPPIGLPYMEQHAFFFIALSIWLLQKGLQGGAKAYWLILPIAMSLAILSKQQPGLLVLPLIAIAFLAQVKTNNWKPAIPWLGLGFLLSIFPFWAAMGFEFGNLGAFATATWNLPKQAGAARIAAWQYGPLKTIRSFLWYPYQVFPSQIPLIQHLSYLPLLLFPIEKWLRNRIGLPPIRSELYKDLALPLALTLSTSFFLHFSQNQPQNGLALFPLIMGLLHQFYASHLGPLFKPANILQKSTTIAGNLLLLAATAFLVFDFNGKVNATRLVLDFSEEQPYAPISPDQQAIPMLSFDAPYDGHFLRPGELVEWLKEKNMPFFLFGDMSFIYGLTGQANPFPSLWHHAGLTYPAIDSPDFAAFDAKAKEQVAAAAPAYAIFESGQKSTYMHVALSDFPKLEAYLLGKKLEDFEVGGFWIWKLNN